MSSKIDLLEELELSLGVYETLQQYATTTAVEIRGKLTNIEDIKNLPIYLYSEQEIMAIIATIDKIHYNLPEVVRDSIINNIKATVN